MTDEEQKNIRTAIKNKNVDADMGACTKLLGSMFAVHRFGGFWAQHGDDMAVVAADALLDYVASEAPVDSNSVAVYKLAQKDFMKFFLQCYKESEDNVRAQEADEAPDDV